MHIAIEMWNTVLFAVPAISFALLAAASWREGKITLGRRTPQYFILREKMPRLFWTGIAFLCLVSALSTGLMV